jgi:putative hydrolase of the HAD superfamily
VKYKAVIFDLFGTLVSSSSHEKYKEEMAQMASVLSVPPDDLLRLWLDTADKRAGGGFKSNEANIEYICHRLGVHPVDTQIKRATLMITDSTKRLLTRVRVDAAETLSQLISYGYRIGLISDCSPAVPLVWKDTALSALIGVAIFSCLAGIQKPNPRIYYLATEQLGVKPKECLYVGDGSNQELLGASQVGMYPILLRIPDEEGTYLRYDDTVEWDGAVISSLKEVLYFIEEVADAH